MTLHKGKHAATPIQPGDLLFHNYTDSAVIDLSGPPPVKTIGHGDKMSTPRLMLGNGPDNTVCTGFDGAGDCVLAMKTNYLRLAWSISGKGLFPATGATAIANYSEETGYVLGDPSTDNGTNMSTSMGHWVKVGYRDETGKRHKIGGYARIKLTGKDGTIDLNHLKWAMYLSDMGVPLGVMFPNSAMTQFNQGKPWEPVKSDPKPDEGHCILADLTYSQGFKTESWARDQDAVDQWITEYVDEAYFPVDEDGTVNGKSIEGFDSQQLLADAKAF